MKKHRIDHQAAPDAAALAALQQEKEALSQQVKRLVKAEGKLYQYQQELDAQLKEYQDLYELNRRLSASFDLDQIYTDTVSYVVQNLDYERAVLLQRMGQDYRVRAQEGYYLPPEREQVAGLVIPQDSPFLSALMAGQEYLICKPESRQPELAEYRSKLLMDEYFLYPLGYFSHPHALLALGNSAETAEFHRRVNQSYGLLLCLGNLTGLISSLVDNRFFYKKLEKALEQQKLIEAKYRNIFENAAEGIFQRTPAGRYLNANPALARMLGYGSVPELITSVTDIGRQLYPRQERHAELMRVLDEQGALERFETEMYRKDGSIIWVSISARAVRDSSGAMLYYEGMVEEITERKRTEEALRESEQRYRQLSEALEQRVRETVAELRQKDKLLLIQSRQAVMGEMLSNIAHQWRQPLNMLGLLAQDLHMTHKMTGLTGDQIDANVQKTLEIIGQMSKTIDDFRYFFKPETVRVEFRVQETIEKTLSLLEGSFKLHGIEVEAIQGDDPVISGYPAEFIQVLLNILINARDALSSGKVATPRIEIRLFSEDGKTVVTITDNAGGVPEEIRDKIFEPYFTTKGPEQGTGIGLFMSKTIIEKNMKGRLSVRNVGDGAEFRIEIRSAPTTLSAAS